MKRCEILGRIIRLRDSSLSEELARQAFCYTPRSVIKEVAKTLSREELENFYADALLWTEQMENWTHHISGYSTIYRLFRHTDYEKVVLQVADELIGGVSGFMDSVNEKFEKMVEDMGEDEYHKRIERNMLIYEQQKLEGKIEGYVSG